MQLVIDRGESLVRAAAWDGEGALRPDKVFARARRRSENAEQACLIALEWFRQNYCRDPERIVMACDAPIIWRLSRTFVRVRGETVRQKHIARALYPLERRKNSWARSASHRNAWHIFPISWRLDNASFVHAPLGREGKLLQCDAGIIAPAPPRYGSFAHDFPHAVFHDIPLSLGGVPVFPVWSGLASCYGGARNADERMADNEKMPHCAAASAVADNIIAVEVGHYTSRALVMIAGKLVSVRVLPMGGAALIADLAFGLSTDSAHALRALRTLLENRDAILKLQHNGMERLAKRELLERLVAPRLAEIAEGLVVPLENSPWRRSVKRIVLIGPIAAWEVFQNQLERAEIGLPFLPVCRSTLNTLEGCTKIITQPHNAILHAVFKSQKHKKFLPIRKILRKTTGIYRKYTHRTKILEHA